MILIQMKRDYTPPVSEWQTPRTMQANSFHVVIETLEDGLIGRTYSPQHLTYVDLHYSYFRVCDRDWQTFQVPNLGREFRAEELAAAKQQLAAAVNQPKPQNPETPLVGREPTSPVEQPQEATAPPPKETSMIANAKKRQVIKTKVANVQGLSRESQPPPQYPSPTFQKNFGGKTLARVSLAKLERHPKNRVPTSEAVSKMVKSITDVGLLDPIVVRQMPGHWQIISGETRVLALTVLHGPKGEVDANVIQCDDVQALRLLAIYNAERTDLTSIEKAKTIRDLREVGQTWEEAGSIYHLSAAAAQNLVTILDAPEVWQERHVKPDICGVSKEPKPVHQATLRAIAKFASVPGLLDELNGDYVSGDWEETRDWQIDSVESLARRLTRDPSKENYVKANNSGGWFKCQFKITDELRQRLAPMDLPLGEKGKSIEVFTNHELYDQLQVAECEKRSRGKHSAAADRDAATPLNAAEKKAQAKEQAERLEKRIANWRSEWLKYLIADKLDTRPDLVQRILLWIGAKGGFLATRFNEALALAVGRLTDNSRDLDSEQPEWEWLADRDENKLFAVGRDAIKKLLAFDERNPDYPTWPRYVTEDLAKLCRLDLADAWLIMQTLRVQQPKVANSEEVFVQFFELHQSDQLDALGEELGVFTGNAKTKSAKVKLLSECIRVLKLPKSIEPVVFAASAKPAKKGKQVSS